MIKHKEDVELTKATRLTCKKRITWGGAVCYGMSFSVATTSGKTYAICEKCGNKIEIGG